MAVSEQRILCPKCSNPKRKCYLNIEKAVMYCFHCGYGAKSWQPNQRTNYRAVRAKKQLKQEEARGISLELLPDEHPALLYLRSRGLSKEEVLSFGPCLYNNEARYQGGALIFPITMFGIYIGFQARLITKGGYLSSKNFKRANALFNFDRARALTKTAVLCEGIFDALKIGSDAIASFGTQVTNYQEELIARHFDQVIIFFDSDARDEACSLALRFYHRSIRTKICFNENGDPGDHSLERNRDIIREARDWQDVFFYPY